MSNVDASPRLQGWLKNLDVTSQEAARRTDVLLEFCKHVEATPDELVLRCFRTTANGELAIRSKGRTEVARAIDEFLVETERDGHEAVVAGNVIRSFLIYNGVFLPGRASTE